MSDNAENKTELVTTVTQDNVIKLDENYEDIFVTEKDTFTVVINYYKDAQNALVVETIDETFDKNIPSKKISVTFKFPSQGDIASIANNPIRGNIKNIENISINEFLLLELSRFMCLIRSWSLPNKISSETIMSINPKIIKGILYLVRKEIGTEGII